MKSINSKLKKYNTKTISLRLATERDAESIYEMLQEKEFKRFYLDRLIPKNVEAAKKMIKKFLKESEKGNVFYFAVEYKGKFAGVVDIFRTHEIDRRSAIGYGVTSEFRGKGIGTKATKIMLKFMAKDLNLHSCEAETDQKNIGSQKVLEKNGFRKVGLMKDYYFSGGKYVDRLLYWKVL